MRLFKYILVFGLVIFGFTYVNAGKARNFQYKSPNNFTQEINYFPAFFPSVYSYTGSDKITVMIPPEIKTVGLDLPKTKTGALIPEFLEGKRNFNTTFGIENWEMSSYRFTITPYGERLEVLGSYTSLAGIKTEFMEHHYFGKNVTRSIHLFYPTKSDGKIVEQAKLSLQTFNPNIN